MPTKFPTSDNRKRLALKMQDCIEMCAGIRAEITMRGEVSLRELLNLQEEVVKAIRYATDTSDYDR
jgi:hypothetical protein